MNCLKTNSLEYTLKMILSNLSKKFDFAIFGAVPYNHVLRGRTGALVDNLCQRGFYVNYFEMPPASVLQYFKNPMSYHRGLLDFLFPKPTVSANLIIYSFPPVFPAARFETGWIKRYNQQRVYRSMQTQYLPLARERNRPVVALVATPWWYEAIKRINFSLLCYDCIDDIRVFCSERQLKYFLELQRELIEKSDLIFISAKKLENDIISVRPTASIEFLPNGVDADYFSAKGSNIPIPPKFKNLPRPIIGFVGTLYYWIDTQILETMARTFTNSSIVLVGPVKNIKIPMLPNIHLLPPIPYSSVPEYISAFDVCVIPFIADSLSEKVDPIKVYEYLSLGKPVVAINLAELEKVRELIYLAKDKFDFINCIRIALEENDPQLRERRMAYARQNSWAIRVEQLIGTVENYLNKKKNEFNLQISQPI